jgi:RNA polymerase sigma factor (TIGR02999 family)
MSRAANAVDALGLIASRPSLNDNVAMSDVTRILSQLDSGDPAAAEQLLPLVYDELRKLAAARLAHEKPGQTLQATALVNEAYLRLVGSHRQVEPVDGAAKSSAAEGTYDSRGHFCTAAAEAMRRILIDQARRREALKRGGQMQRQDLDDVQIAAPEPSVDLLALDEALTRFQQLDPPKAELVRLRYFAGLTVPQAAEALGISTTTADRYWAYARAWLHAELSREK